jgi:hypothetical protein
MKRIFTGMAALRSLSFRFLVIAVPVLFACSGGDGVTVVHLTGLNPESEDIPFMKFPFRIGLDDSVAVVLDLAADSCFYHVLSWPGLRHLYSLGRRGNGPGEIILPTPFQLRGGHLRLFDGNRGNLFDVDLAGKRNLDLGAYTRFDLNGSVDFVCLDDTTLLLGDGSGRNRLLRATPGGRTGVLEFPPGLAEDDVASRGRVWRSYMDMNYELNRVALATQFGEVLEIADLGDRSVVRTTGSGGVPRAANQQLAGYYDVKWRGNDVYVLYSDMTESEANRQPANNRRPPSGGDQIHVFDQNGVRTKIYRLDVAVNGFAVDEKNGLLVGISSDSDCPVYLFRLD